MPGEKTSESNRCSYLGFHYFTGFHAADKPKKKLIPEGGWGAATCASRISTRGAEGESATRHQCHRRLGSVLCPFDHGYQTLDGDAVGILLHEKLLCLLAAGDLPQPVSARHRLGQLGAKATESFPTVVWLLRHNISGGHSIVVLAVGGSRRVWHLDAASRLIRFGISMRHLKEWVSSARRGCLGLASLFSHLLYTFTYMSFLCFVATVAIHRRP